MATVTRQRGKFCRPHSLLGPMLGACLLWGRVASPQTEELEEGNIQNPAAASGERAAPPAAEEEPNTTEDIPATGEPWATDPAQKPTEEERPPTTDERAPAPDQETISPAQDATPPQNSTPKNPTTPPQAPHPAAQEAESTPPLHSGAEPWYPTSGQLGITVGVPFYDESIINADMTVDIRYGRKIGWFVPYFAGGFRQARLDPKRVPDEARRKRLEAWHMTLGLRVEVPATRHLLPFVGVAGELAHWGFEASTADFCQEAWYPDAWRCYERYQWKAGRAFKGQIGVLYKPYPDLALEFWVEKGRIYAPEMFTRSVTFINPAVGVAWHH